MRDPETPRLTKEEREEWTTILRGDRKGGQQTGPSALHYNMQDALLRALSDLATVEAERDALLREVEAERDRAVQTVSGMVESARLAAEHNTNWQQRAEQAELALAKAANDYHLEHSGLGFRKCSNAICSRIRASLQTDAEKEHRHECGMCGEVECHRPSCAAMTFNPRWKYIIRPDECASCSPGVGK